VRRDRLRAHMRRQQESFHGSLETPSPVQVLIRRSFSPDVNETVLITGNLFQSFCTESASIFRISAALL
jgi:hypothetical protein